MTPGGFEAYFSEVEPVLAVDGPPDMGALAAIAARYGLAVDPASIARLAAAHGLMLGGCPTR